MTAKMSVPQTVCFAELPTQFSNNNHNHNNNNNHHHHHHDLETNLLQLRPRNESPSSSVSISPTPRYERNMSFFQQLSRRFGLRSNDDLLHVDDAAAVAAAIIASSQSTEDDINSSSTDSMSTSDVVAMTKANNAKSPAATTNGLLGTSLEHMSCASSETSSTIDDTYASEQDTRHQHDNQQQPCKRKSSTRSSFSHLHRRSTSSLRRAFESLSLTSRSLSCSGPSPPPTAITQPNSTSSPQQKMPLKSVLKSASTVDLHKHKTSSSSSASTRSSTSLHSSSSSTASRSSKSKPPPQRILRQPVSYRYLKGISGLPTQRVPRSSVCCPQARR